MGEDPGEPRGSSVFRSVRMSGIFVHTLGDASQIPNLFTGVHLQGRSEPRIAIVGRSNVGKSSLINALLESRVAQTSNQPGKTRAIHFYLWPEAGKIIADLPGYGFAKAGHAERERWARFINGYLRSDPALIRAIVLLDARHGPTELDIEAIRFLGSEGVPIAFVFSKADTLKTQSERAARRKEAAAALEKLGFDPSSALWVSSKSKDGLKHLGRTLADL